MNTPEQQRVVDEIKARGGEVERRADRKRSTAVREPSRGEQAARHAHDTGCSFVEAAMLFAITPAAVGPHFDRLFPDVSIKGRYRK